MHFMKLNEVHPPPPNLAPIPLSAITVGTCVVSRGHRDGVNCHAVSRPAFLGPVLGFEKKPRTPEK